MRTAPLVAAALAVGALAACSGGGSGAHDGATTSTAPATSTTVHYTGDPHSAFCTELGRVASDAVTEDRTQDPAAVEAGMTRYRQELEDLDAAAPEAIKVDVHRLATGIGNLADALHSVGYSWDQLASADNAVTVEAEISDPAYTTAGDHLTAYKSQVCHL